MTLSKGAITQMIQQAHGIDQQYYVKASRFVYRGNKIQFTIADQQDQHPAFCVMEQTTKKNTLKQKSGKQVFIIINEHETNMKNSKAIIQIIQYKLQQTKQTKESNIKLQNSQQSKKKNIKQKNQTIKNLHIKQTNISLFYNKNQKNICLIPENIQQNNKNNINKEPLSIIKKQFNIKSQHVQKHQKQQRVLKTIDDQQQTQPIQMPIDVNNFQKISDLYQNIYGWQLLVRVIQKSYRQFTTKTGRPTQIFNITFIDKTGWTIEGVSFGQQAQYYNSFVQQGKVYRVARGRLKQQQPQKITKQRQSRYIIVFGKDSSIYPIGQILSIPLCRNNWLRLSQIAAIQDINAHYTFVAILLQISKQKMLSKTNKTITMQYFKVGDPISQKIIDGVIWNKQIVLNQKDIGTSIILRHFKISKYNDQNQLSTSYKSSISPFPFFKDYQRKWIPIKSQIKQQKYLSIADLKSQLQNKQVVTFISQMQVLLVYINFDSKWYYQSCNNPKCKKAAISFAQCMHCMTVNKQCQKKYLLNLQFCDYTGSIKVTAFDEAAFQLTKKPLQELQKIQKEQLIAYGQNNITYKTYKIQIHSKKDNSGYFKHSLSGKIFETNLNNSIMRNICKIKQLMNQQMTV